MNIKLIGNIFLIYFLVLVVLIFATWIKFVTNVKTYGGEMGDSYLLFALILITIYFAIFTAWTYRVAKKTNTISIRIKLLFIFLFGVCPSAICLLFFLNA
jgi:uncharacterized membrane protein